MIDRREHRPRLLTDDAEADMEGALPLPVRTSRSALAPKLNLRPNWEAEGEFGELFTTASPSSTAFSSIEVDGEVLLPKLLCRFLMLAKGDV